MRRGALQRAARLAAASRELGSLVALPRRVRSFYLRAYLTALRTHDRFSLVAAARPREVRKLLALARGSANVVELGTGTGWTAVALALADERRRVVTYDPSAPLQQDRYLRLVGADVRARVELRTEPGEAPSGRAAVDLLFVDIGFHTMDSTRAAFVAWEPFVVPGGIVAFHDYGEKYPGVREAVEDLGLDGEVHGILFVWHKPGC